MLNELLEYKQYTFDPDDDKHPERLKLGTFIRENRTGLNRALTTIARHSLYNKKYSVSGASISEEDIAHTKDVLRAWLGFQTGGETHGHELQDWLARYMILVLLRKKAGKADPVKDEVRRYLEEYLETGDRKRVCRDIYNKYECRINRKTSISNQLEYIAGDRFHKDMESGCYDTSPENDMNKITLDRVVANSIREGRLKNHAMVCQKSAYEKALPDVNIDPGVNIKKPNTDVIQKTTAYYLLTCQKRNICSDASCFVPICRGDLTNWLKKDSCGAKEISCYRYKGERLFARRSLDNTSLLQLNANWVKDCNWRLIEMPDETNGEDIPLPADADSLYFIDAGAGKELIVK